MCTAMTILTPKKDIIFGRTMDFSYPLAPELYFIPKGYRWNNIQNTHQIRNQYRVMGIGQNISPVILADGINEMGFAAAALYFPGYAQYDEPDVKDTSTLCVAALEMVNFLLGQCASVEHAALILKSIRIVGVKDAVTNSVAPLHWLIADRQGRCMTVEKTEDGLSLMENPIGVLANSPDFNWHMTNLRSYRNLEPHQKQESSLGSVKLTPFGQGGGTFGMPGDYTPPSRFVRTAFQKSYTVIPAEKNEAVTACFHILESVSIPKGVVMTDRGTPDYTQYTAFANLSSLEYYFKSYENPRIVTAKLPSGSGDSDKIISLSYVNQPVKFDFVNRS